MFKVKQIVLSLASLSLLASASMIAHATPAQAPHFIVAPQCLLQKISPAYTTLAKTSDFAFITMNDAQLDALIEAKHHSAKGCGGFKDVSLDWNTTGASLKGNQPNALHFLKQETQAKPTLSSLKTKDYTLQHEVEVNKLMAGVSPDQMWNRLTTFTNFKDRYAKSDNGVAAANWIKSQVEQIASDTGHSDVSIEYIATGSSYKQPSVVAKLGKGTGPGIVIGGHMDTLASTSSNKPGADDDGSGSMTVLEAARTILASGMQFNKPIYFVWYAAEEEGLVGSSYVVSSFKSRNIPVDAVVQFDMTGYSYKNDPTMWLLDDHVNKALTSFMDKLITTYVKQPVKYTHCGYACSDHASWDSKGFAAAMPFESSFGTDNPNIHTSNDKMEHLSLKHMTNYAKLAVAFAAELGEPKA